MFYRTNILKTIATSKFTLPVIAVISLIFWGAASSHSPGISTPHGLGLWKHIPDGLAEGWGATLLGLALSMAAVYLMTEFNNKFVLLRVSSRMLGSILALLLTMCTFMHNLQPAHIVLVSVMTAYFPLHYSYQRIDSMPLIFVATLIVSTASLIFPKLLLITPFLWAAMIILRSLTARTLCASILGIAVPYWFVFSIAYINGCLQETSDLFADSLRMTLPDYSSWTMHHWMTIGIVALMGISGAANFYMRSYLDKTRTRTYLNISVLMLAASLAFLLWETAHFNEFMPIALTSAAMLSGHYLAQTYNRFTNIYTLLLAILIACVGYANYIGI
jgi:hypothetical protein